MDFELKLAVGVAALGVSSICQAQSDGANARAFAAQCSHNEQTPACSQLRDAIVREAVRNATALPIGSNGGTITHSVERSAREATSPATPPVVSPALLPPQIEPDFVDERMTTVGVKAVDALGQFLDGFWLQENPVPQVPVETYKFTWDGAQRRLSIEKGYAGVRLKNYPETIDLAYYPEGTAAELRGKWDDGFGSRTQNVTWKLSGPMRLVSDTFYSFGKKKWPAREAILVGGPDRIGVYRSVGTKLSLLYTYYRIPAGDPQGVLARDAATGRAWFAEDAAKRANKSQHGSSGLFGALAMGFGAAMAGGNPEMVMGAAMKGAELTTDNEMARNVLAGQGDQMMQSGFNTMVAQNRVESHAAGDAQAGSASANAVQTRDQSTMTTALSGTPHPAYSYCFHHAGFVNGKAVSYASQQGVNQSSSLLDLDPRLSSRWSDFLRLQNLNPQDGRTGCISVRTTTDAASSYHRFVVDNGANVLPWIPAP